MNRRPRGLFQSREHGFQDPSKPVLSLEVPWWRKYGNFWHFEPFIISYRWELSCGSIINSCYWSLNLRFSRFPRIFARDSLNTSPDSVLILNLASSTMEKRSCFIVKTNINLTDLYSRHSYFDWTK